MRSSSTSTEWPKNSPVAALTEESFWTWVQVEPLRANTCTAPASRMLIDSSGAPTTRKSSDIARLAPRRSTLPPPTGVRTLPAVHVDPVRT